MGPFQNLIMGSLLFAVPFLATASQQCAEVPSASSATLLQVDAKNAAQRKVESAKMHKSMSKETMHKTAANLTTRSVARSKSKTANAVHASKLTEARTQQRSRSNTKDEYEEENGKCGSRKSDQLHVYWCSQVSTAEGIDGAKNSCQRAADAATSISTRGAALAYTYDISMFGEAEEEDEEDLELAQASASSETTDCLVVVPHCAIGCDSEELLQKDVKHSSSEDWYCPFGVDGTNCCWIPDVLTYSQTSDTFTNDCNDEECPEDVEVDDTKDWMCAQIESEEDEEEDGNALAIWASQGQYQKCAGCDKSSSELWVWTAWSCMTKANSAGVTYFSYRPDKMYCCLMESCTPVDTNPAWEIYHFS